MRKRVGGDGAVIQCCAGSGNADLRGSDTAHWLFMWSDWKTDCLGMKSFSVKF